MGAADEEAGDASPGNGEEKIYVSVRLRPLNDKEISRNDVTDWECINDNTVIYKNSLSVSERFMYPTAYTFDRVFGPECSTRQVYEEGAKVVALSVVSGINSSVFAYGQTSSGKTYTMSGITEYAVADIYDYIEKHKERDFLLKFSAMEIYNESVRDLLSSDTTPLRLLDDPERGTVVERLTEETLRDWNHFKELLSVCEAQRQIGETNLNEASSRSHQILRLTIDSSAREFLGNDKSSTLTATVNFVDLAGSERASQSLSAGMRLKEGCHINRSLLTLGTVIRKLSKGRTGHIPFRDSKLTRILQSSLGGNARTAIICTLSPARIHVEQSRNTLLFASCAKEVMTNARVNVVVSDKALVKQLQREVARLENELRSTGISNTTFDSTALLREKDLQIEQLMKEVKELTWQLELAQSQVEDLLQAGADNKTQIAPVAPANHYPKLRVRSSWKSEISASNSSISEDTQTVDVGVRSYEVSHFSNAQSSSSSNGSSSASDDEKFVQFPDFEDYFGHSNPSPLLSISSNNFVENDLRAKDTEEQIDEDSPDVCKEVKCIEVEESSTNRYAKSNKLSPKKSSDNSGVIEIRNEEIQSHEFVSARLKEQPEELNDSISCFIVQSPEKPSPSIKEQEGLNDSDSAFIMHSPENLSPWIKVHEESNGSDAVLNIPSPEKPSSWMQEQKDSNATDSAFIVPSPEKASPWMTEGSLSASRSLRLRSRSCRARLVGNLPNFYFDNVEDKNENTPSIWFEKEFTGRPESCQRKIPSFKYGLGSQKLSRNNSTTSVASDDVHELQVHTVDNKSEILNSDGEMMHAADQLVQNPQMKPVVPEKKVKDVGLDPIPDDGDIFSIQKWPTEFKRLQGEIIDLWHACNVSLVHRTYFFLLFKGDPADSFYMEVELRKLCFLKDTFSRRIKTMVNGRIISINSSKKDLDRERLMLSREMQRRLSTEEREQLFLKWGVPLNGSHRRLQLVHSLWTKTRDMEHVTESASLVAKLVGFEEEDQSLKDMFGLLNFAPKPSCKRSSIWKWLL